MRDSNADLNALTETWLTVDDTAASLAIISNGYELINHPQQSVKVVALLFCIETILLS